MNDPSFGCFVLSNIKTAIAESGYHGRRPALPFKNSVSALADCSMNTERTKNPYQTPSYSGEGKHPHQQSGIWFLVVGVSLMICAVIFILYLMIDVVPEIKDKFDSRGLQMDPKFWSSVRLIDFLVKYWMAWPIIFTTLILCNEFFAPIQYKYRIRKNFGITLGGVAVFSVVWMLWITIP